jgi:periplasmic copper chaperone A
MLSKSTFRAATMIFACALPVSAIAEANIEVHDAYVISAVPGAPTAAAFMVIQNHGGPADRLIDVASPAAERVELHNHIEDEAGVMRMLHVQEGIALPADGEIVMQRGGFHVMFMGLSEPLVQDMVVPVTLTFETAGEIEIDVPVDLERLTGDAMTHGNMNQGTMNHDSGN